MTRPRPADQPERTLRAAAELFVDLGRSATSTAAIAQRAGIGVATLYHYFENRQAIDEWVVRHAAGWSPDGHRALPLPLPADASLADHVYGPMTDLTHTCPDVLHALAAPPGRRSVRQLVDALVGVNRRCGDLLFLLEAIAAEDADAADALSGLHRALVEQLSSWLAEGQRARRVRATIDPSVAAEMVLLNAAFYARTWRRDLPVAAGTHPEPPEDMLRSVERALLR